ncbi:MAG: hypothetical protein ACR2KJ_04765 [Jatrophihabitans sp.]
MITSTPAPTRPAIRSDGLSAVLVALAATAAAAGIASGGVMYLDRSNVRERHSADTAAWWPHLGLAILAAALLLTAAVQRRRSGERGLGLLSPLTRSAARRVWLTVRTAPHRALLSAPFGALMLYNVYRAAEQVVAGLDPNFTANAWGGPSYLGAMACHYLDGALLIAAGGWVVSRLLVRPGGIRS